MIQRIQSLYLLLGAGAMLALTFMNGAWQSVTVDFVWFNPLLSGLILLTAVLALWTIMQYKNRKKQRKLVLLVQVLTILTIVVLFGGLLMQGRLQVYTDEAIIDTEKIIAYVLPIAAYAFFYLARFTVQRDIELIKSMDRLR